MNLGRQPFFLQGDATECGLACFAMVAAHYDPGTHLDALRETLGSRPRGMTLASIADAASDCGFVCRGLACALPSLPQVRLPAIAHWDLDHFVVITRVHRHWIEVADPASGIQRIANSEAEKHYTGHLLELLPGSHVALPRARPGLTVIELVRRLRGIGGHLRSIAALALLVELLALASPLLIQFGVDTCLGSARLAPLLVLGMALMVMVLLQSGCAAVRELTSSELNARVSHLLSTSAFAAVLQWPFKTLIERPSADLLSRFSSLDNVRHGIIQNTVQLGMDGLLLLVASLLLCLYSPMLTLLALATAGLHAVIRHHVLLRQLAHDAASVQHVARQHSVLIETLRAAHVIKAHGAEATRQRALDQALTPAVHAHHRSQWLGAIARSGWIALTGLQTAIVLVVALQKVQTGNMTLGMMYACLGINLMLLQRCGSVIEQWSQLRLLQVHLQRASELLCNPQLLSAGEHTLAPVPLRSHEVVARGLSYAFSPAEPPVLQGLDFSVGCGEIVALTGPSGCGKSTLLRLLCGMAEPTAGVIRIGGQAPHPSQSAIVLQDDVLLSGSLLDNICFFSAQPDVDWAQECARMASILDDINAMPMRMHTRVGELGSRLSGGQRQRIVLARALYRRPSLLLLDEATSHLDANNERQILQAIRQLGITVIHAAHRQETLAEADRILQLQRPAPAVQAMQDLPH